MKTDITFLPENKQQELRQIVTTICDLCDDVVMVILYGSYARNKYRDEKDVDPDARSERPSDYDIMVITKLHDTAINSALWHKVEQEVRLEGGVPQIRIITQNLKRMKMRLKDQHFFYSDIVRDGVVLYNPKENILKVAPSIANSEKLRIAQEHYENWFPESRGFHKMFTYGFKECLRNEAVFNLHQSAERCLKGLLAVLVNYVPKDHWLSDLEKQLALVFPEILTVFPRPTEEDEKRFENFDNAYIGARYEKDYFISDEDLVYFGQRVEVLLDLAEKKWREHLPKLEMLSLKKK